ncbi:hypothetical protein P171DRAFT_429652 [Karstenula rhodostoma CBS 690.94]|uniref:Uncharacterized protein n=1 Tax=Karstenula rhodostoma CBS 690.94 TaxID=1392251 RepID=A0A9P4UEY1_9PLEO|nr:hypothetical protein P171DRAFT_429652 [Karstenula rhodostoma CBS 690.94]
MFGSSAFEGMFESCDLVDDDETAFYDQAPRSRCIGVDGKDNPGYLPMIRSDVRFRPEEPRVGKVPPPVLTETQKNEIYKHWQSSGKIGTAISFGALSFRARRECEILARLYEHADPDFQDAVIDAIAEWMDDYQHDTERLYPVAKNSSSKLMQLLAFQYALVTHPNLYGFRVHGPMDEPEFEKMVKDFVDGFSKEETYRDIWTNFMQDGRCQFHQHRAGKCWRTKL